MISGKFLEYVFIPNVFPIFSRPIDEVKVYLVEKSLLHSILTAQPATCLCLVWSSYPVESKVIRHGSFGLPLGYLVIYRIHLVREVL